MTNTFSLLTDKELDWLDNFLLDRIDEDAVTEGMNEGILNVSELDGLFTAVVSGPTVIPPSQWMPVIWGDFEPVWEKVEDAEKVMSLLMRHMDSIASTLMQQPEEFEPMFLYRKVEGKTYTIVDDWCDGYMSGVFLATDEWNIDENMELRILLAPIFAFDRRHASQTHDQYESDEIQNVQNAITPNVREIHAYWLSRRQHLNPSTPFARTTPKVGRNDPCPCGSGKKYKKCCLH